MSLDLNSNIPYTSPYKENKKTVDTIHSDMVDWILVELRTSELGSAISSKSAFLRKDGKVIADDGVTETINLDAPEGDYYIVVKHRNHLSIMTSNKINLNSSTPTFHDFTISGN